MLVRCGKCGSIDLTGSRALHCFNCGLEFDAETKRQQFFGTMTPEQKAKQEWDRSVRAYSEKLEERERRRQARKLVSSFVANLVLGLMCLYFLVRFVKWAWEK